MNTSTASRAEVASPVVERALATRDQLEALGRNGRATLLENLADRFSANEAVLVETARRETHLPVSRLVGEVARVAAQFRLFADVLRDGAYLQVVSEALPDSKRIFRMNLPLGVVAVFGASNFPLAFSVPGGDVVSALAAGCPVVVKVHDLHPETSEICAEIIRSGLTDAGVSADALGLVYGRAAAIELVQHPGIAAVAFTGSQSGGAALRAAIDARPDPIPFYGELGSVNPAIVLPGAATARGAEIGRELANSIVFSQGQLCTRPGFVFLPSGAGGQSVIEGLQSALAGTTGGPMLSEGILRNYQSRVEELTTAAGVEVLIRGESGEADSATPTLFAATPESARTSSVRAEVFGPAAVVVWYSTVAEAIGELNSHEPALAASIYYDTGTDRDDVGRVAGALEKSVGRIVFNGVTTGVAVNWAQNHTGPWPASTTRFTSVGAAAIDRFVRPVAWQDAPTWILRDELREAGIVPRRVDGVIELPS